MSRKSVGLTLLALGALALVAWPVYAHCGKCAESCKEMVTALDAGKVTLTKAITAAETHSKGKAVAALCHLDGSTLGFTVFCMSGDKLNEVSVDNTGKATEMMESKGIPTAHEHAGAAK